MIEAIFFDMDNTLVSTEWASAKAVAAVVRQHGREMADEDINDVYGLPWSAVFENTIRKYSLGLDSDALKEEVLKEKERILGDTLSPLKGAVEAVRLCGKRYPIAVVTGSFRGEAHQTMEKLGLKNAFRFILSNDDVTEGKPTPEPYLTAAKRLNVPIEKTLVFEDSDMGILSAKAAGAYCVVVQEASHAKMHLMKADETIPSLEAVTEAWLDALDKKI